MTVHLRREDEMLIMQWIERGGPVVETAPTHTGFGSRLEKATLGGLGATIARTWDREGLSLTVALPVERLAG